MHLCVRGPEGPLCIHLCTTVCLLLSLCVPVCLRVCLCVWMSGWVGGTAAAELMVKAYSRSFRLPVLITRSNNVYGPRQFPEKIIPKFILQLLREQPWYAHVCDCKERDRERERERRLSVCMRACVGGWLGAHECSVVSSPLSHSWLHGDGSNKRRYLHVDDVAEAFETILRHGAVGTNKQTQRERCKHRRRRGHRHTREDRGTLCERERGALAARPSQTLALTHLIAPWNMRVYVCMCMCACVCAGEVYNIGTDEEHSNLDVARHLLRACGLADREASLLQYVTDRAFNDRRYYIDSAKLHALGWRPRVPFDQGLQRTSTPCAARFHKHKQSE
jgi:hypothetical protein